MTRSNARELAVHLIYGRDFTGETPEEVVSVRLGEEYYSKLAQENEVYTERPSRKQKAYIDAAVAGVAEKAEELNGIISRYAIGWDIKRISRLARAVMQLAIYETLYVDDVPTGVAVSEAVRIIKQYESEETASFVNGILGSFARALNTPVPLPEVEETAPVETEAE